MTDRTFEWTDDDGDRLRVGRWARDRGWLVTVSGEQDLRKTFTDMTATETEVETREGRIWVAGEHAFAEWSYDEMAADGQIRVIRGIDVIHISDGLIQSIDAYRKSS